MKNCLIHHSLTPGVYVVSEQPCTCHPDDLAERDREYNRGCQAHDMFRPIGVLSKSGPMYFCTCDSKEIKKREKWILSLKDGDDVLIADRHLDIEKTTPAKVHTVVKKGVCHVNGEELPLPVIIVKHGDKTWYFNSTGYVFGGTGFVYLAPPIKEILEEAERQQLIKHFSTTMFTYSLEKLRRMKELG